VDVVAEIGICWRIFLECSFTEKGVLEDKKDIRFKVELLKVIWEIVKLLLRIF
jgi:hypothetical protein